MGIRGFRGWFESQFGDALIELPKQRTTTGSPSPKSKSQAAHKSTSQKTPTTDTFDHVLIDVNQLLHVCIRKSRSDGHALTLLMKELDTIVQQIIPTQSLVLALDGPPSAAKLATQRQRRLAIWRKAQQQSQSQQLQQQRRTGRAVSHAKKRNVASELRTLEATPGTDLMQQAHQALLYYAWQRMDNHHHRKSTSSSSSSKWTNNKNIQIYISPSTVPGEGEVKLLEWIYRHVPYYNSNESIAILGGDSDLVVEALVLPHINVFVLLPDGNARYLCVSVWETTLSLSRVLVGGGAASPSSVSSSVPQQPPSSSAQDSVSQQQQPYRQWRTDLVLLLIFNGNDYLPKLRGSSGFHKLFHNYVAVMQSRGRRGNGGGTAAGGGAAAGDDNPFRGLVDPRTLELQLDVCIHYFERLADLTPPRPWMVDTVRDNAATTITPLQRLHHYVDAGYLPRPVEFTIVSENMDDVNENDDDRPSPARRSNTGRADEDDIESEDPNENDNDDEDDGVIAAADDILVKLELGVPESDEYCVYEIRHPKKVPWKQAKHKLSQMAIDDILDLDDDEEDALGMTVGPRYEWEIRHAAEANVESYLYGLLWNLQTYQDGICADYAYNYGKRRSPTAADISSFLKKARARGETVGPKQLRDVPFTPPIDAGLSCLAALPVEVKHLVPEPYRWLSDETVEALYSSCFDKLDNTFDIKRFERSCHEQLAELEVKLVEKKSQMADTEKHDGRRIFMSDHSWTVVSLVGKPLVHPFDPPAPFSDRLSKLRSNNRIRVSKLAAIQEPRLLSSSSIPIGQPAGRRPFASSKAPRDSPHADSSSFINNDLVGSIDEVVYKTAFQSSRRRNRPKNEKIKMTAKASSEVKATGKLNIVEVPGTTRNQLDVPVINDHSVPKLPEVLPSTSDGLSAMACLKQLEDSGVVGTITWETISPSPTLFARFAPEKFECIRLAVEKAAKDTRNGALHENVKLEQDRELGTISKQAVKQHLASLALCEITGPGARWTDHSYRDLRLYLQQKSTAKGLD